MFLKFSEPLSLINENLTQ